MKNTVRLTESQLHQVIKESVKRVLNESKGFANKEQSKMMDWKKKRTDVFYDKDGKPISKKYTPRDKDGIPKPIKVRETQLHNIVKETINKVIQEQ